MASRALLAAVALARAAAITLPTHLASSMVLPRDVAVPVWGLDAPGATVTITVGDGSSAVVNATVAADGRFDATLPAAPANAAPFTLSFLSSSGAPAVVLSDLVRGDLYVCSGQSNMERVLFRAARLTRTSFARPA